MPISVSLPVSLAAGTAMFNLERRPTGWVITEIR
jgi:hypothetical protein